MSYLTRNEVERLLRVPPGILAKFIIKLDFPKPYRLIGANHDIWSREEIERWLDFMREQVESGDIYKQLEGK